MVYCVYCGEKNKDRRLKCIKCGKPLSLLPNDYSENLNSNRSRYTNKKRLNKEFKNDYKGNQDNINQRSIKSNYKDFNRYENGFDKNKYRNNQTKRLNNLSSSQTNYYGVDSRENLKKPYKKYVEWDVVVATALLVIILSTILQRFFPRLGLLVALFVGLVYILIATKSKLTLIKAIPLSIIMVFAISAYFSL
jgi:lipopolysaccharide export LptBFGC system permease protein LptF